MKLNRCKKCNGKAVGSDTQSTYVGYRIDCENCRVWTCGVDISDSTENWNRFFGESSMYVPSHIQLNNLCEIEIETN